MLPMDLAWQLLKMSEAEMREAGYLDYYSPENIANYYQKRRMRYGSRLPSNLRNEIISEQLARGNRMLAAGIPEELMYAHHDYPPLLEARMNVPERKLHLLPYEADERSQIADLEDVASRIDMNPRAVYNNQRLFRQMIPENFAMEEPEIEQIIEESPIPGMVFINGVLSVDPRNQKSEPMDLAWRLLKMPKPDFPYYGNPEEFSISHNFIPWNSEGEEHLPEDDNMKIIEVAAHQGLEEYGMEPMKYGHASFYVENDKLIPRTAYTHPSFRRGGIATDLYNHAEQVTGLPVVDESPMQSEDALRFWENRSDV